MTCPTCGATGANPCKTASGKIAKRPHAFRVVEQPAEPVAVVEPPATDLDTKAVVAGNIQKLRAQAATKADASARSTRTLLQGLAIDILVAIGVALAAWLPDADLSSREAWIVLATAVGKTVLTAVASYVMRLKVTP